MRPSLSAVAPPGRARAIFLVWLLLIAATLGSFETSFDDGRRLATAIVLVLTAFKVRMILFSYMEVGNAPRWLRLACYGWIAAVFGMIGTCTLIPGALIALLR